MSFTKSGWWSEQALTDHCAPVHRDSSQWRQFLQSLFDSVPLFVKLATIITHFKSIFPQGIAVSPHVRKLNGRSAWPGSEIRFKKAENVASVYRKKVFL
jgi:hypothetical protein